MISTVTQRGKVYDIDALGELLAATRDGRRIVHCHGVFDLLHIGHIRHLQQAKTFGDVLVVTVTPDRHVNKGPTRPVFTEQLRMEAIAALDCVDYVALNKWPRAVEAIGRIRPDFYVKGSDYRDAARDHTGGIVEEQRAVEAVGGQVVFTDEITFSSSSLINQHFSTFPEPVREFLAQFGSRHAADEIHRWLDAARDKRVLVVGEAIIDEYQYCEAIGKSSKEPVLAVKRTETECFAGGILAVANHLASFCDQVSLVTVLGRQNSQEDFIREKLRPNIDPTFFYRLDAPTIVKRRFVDGYFFQKLFEVYEMNDHPLAGAPHRELCEYLDNHAGDFDAVIVLDFGHGMMTAEAIDIVSRRANFLAVNAQSNAANRGYHTVSKYSCADYVCVAENEIRLEARDRHGDLKETMLNVAQKMDCRYVSVTRGARGCLCYSKEQGFIEVPSLAGQVVDRMGAGDTFLALTTLCVLQNAPLEVVGFIGNAAGAQAVATVGNREPVGRASLFKQVECLLK